MIREKPTSLDPPVLPAGPSPTQALLAHTAPPPAATLTLVVPVAPKAPGSPGYAGPSPGKVTETYRPDPSGYSSAMMAFLGRGADPLMDPEKYRRVDGGYAVWCRAFAEKAPSPGAASGIEAAYVDVRLRVLDKIEQWSAAHESERYALIALQEQLLQPETGQSDADFGVAYEAHRRLLAKAFRLD